MNVAGELAPVARVPAAGSLAFLANGDLLVMERSWETELALAAKAVAKEQCVRVHQFDARTYERVASGTIRGLKGSPIGCAASPVGDVLAAGYKLVKLVDWPDAKAIASLKGVEHHLERASLGFSASGERVAVGDGGYVRPANPFVRVFSALDGSELAKLRTGEFSLKQVAMMDDETVVVRGLRVDYAYGSRTEPQHVLACYDVSTGEARWRRRYWSAERWFFADVARGHLWTSGEHILTDESGTAAVERGLECISVRDGATAASLATAHDVYPRGVFALTAGYAVSPIRERDDVSVFAIDTAIGSVTKLAGARPSYGACDAYGRVALSLSSTETGIYVLPST